MRRFSIESEFANSNSVEAERINRFQSRFFIVLPHIVLAISGFHEIESEPFGHFSGRETRAEQGGFLKVAFTLLREDSRLQLDA